jgi:CSLREA domain-containing protein
MMSRTREVHWLKILATTVGAALLVLGLLLAYASSPAWAADITVTTTDDELNDDADCSLREAIEAANTNAAVGGCAAGSDTAVDVIVFSVGQGATIPLSSELTNMLITDDAGLTINGQKNITISGENAANEGGAVFRVEPGAVFNLRNLTIADSHSSTSAGALLNSGGKVKVSNSTFSGNSAADDAGAIANGGTLTVTNSTFSGNNSAGVGGAILTTGRKLTVTNSTFSGNNAALDPGGSGIYNDGSQVVVTDSTFSGNGTSSTGDGGGITNARGTLTVTNSTFSGNGNNATSEGGGIDNRGTLTVNNSTISGNSAELGGGIRNDGTLTVTNSTISGNDATEDGGGMSNAGGATLKVTNSTISGNDATEDGGGIHNTGTLTTLTVNNSTFSGNSASIAGGGIANFFSSPEVINSTFSGNSAALGGGGIFVAGITATATLKNTIVANSTQGGDCTIGVNGAVTDGGFNLIEDGSCITKASSRSGDPNLGALADNGGPTLTMALLAGSKAIDKGKAFGGVTTDQRGLPRPVDFPDITNRGDGSDVGAFEVQP